MAVQIPDPGTGNGQTGDNEYVFRKKVKDNFNDQNNAASRLVGPAAGNLMEVGAFGAGSGEGQYTSTVSIIPIDDNEQSTTDIITNAKTGFFKTPADGEGFVLSSPAKGSGSGIFVFITSSWNRSAPKYTYVSRRNANAYNKSRDTYTFYTTQNATKDANGFLKGASPVIDMYDNKIDLNHDAEQQGGITFEKLGAGDYLVKGSLGFAQEGWYIEMPKDANGNVLVAVVYEQLENNDLSIKTYAKRFDEETGDIVPNVTKPRDIPDGRFISLRLHELPKESQPEV